MRVFIDNAATSAELGEALEVLENALISYRGAATVQDGERSYAIVLTDKENAEPAVKLLCGAGFVARRE